MAAKVEIYSASICPYCVRAKALLRRKGVGFEVHGVWLVLGWLVPTTTLKEMKARSGRDTVPQIFIDGHHVGGCDDLVALDKEGRLDALLGLG
jgi:glutaredoxin 3